MNFSMLSWDNFERSSRALSFEANRFGTTLILCEEAQRGSFARINHGSKVNIKEIMQP